MRKFLLLDTAKSLKIDHIPRYKLRKNDNKKAADVDDILQLWEVLDCSTANVCGC